jgi:DNA-binding response OmpR family regulator
MKALVINGSFEMRRFLIGALSRTGITDVDEASDRIEAVEAISENEYDVVMMGWNLQEMLGSMQ